MRRLTICVMCLLTAPVMAQTPLEKLAVIPPDAQLFTIMSAGGRHGRMARWVRPDGVEVGRESLLLRGQIFETDSTTHFAAGGMADHVAVRGFTPNGDAAEQFDFVGGKANWKSPVDAGRANAASPALYVSFGGPMSLTADVAEALVAAKGGAIRLWPGGEAHAEFLADADVGTGATHQAVKAYALIGLDNSPLPVWMDATGKFFAIAGGLSWVRFGYEADQPHLLSVQDGALARRSPGVVKALLKTPPGPVVFSNVRAFVDGSRFVEGESVVVDHGVITQVAAARDVHAPDGAVVIDGAGKTLVPGLWDAHMHFQNDAEGPILLSLGVTSARDPGSVVALTMSRAARRAKGGLWMPRVYPSLLIDGKGPNTAQVGISVDSQKAALAAVRQAKADGFVAVKIYGSFNPAWVKATAAEAHRLGMHVHGHVPAGMRTMDAINDGYDEITHIYFVMMQAMPDSVVKRSNGMARFEGPGRYAKDVDLNAEPMKSLIATMAARKITVDPTLVVAESLFVPENGDLSPAYAPFVGTLPPTVERGFREGGFKVPKGLTRADYRASFAKLSALVGALHKAGVPIVAGTDGSGLELVRELELYVSAGFTPAEALASATIATAHLVGADGRTGSIAVGKAADLVLVEGDPSIRIGDLRHTVTVMMDGKMMDAAALRKEGGFSGRPAE